MNPAHAVICFFCLVLNRNLAWVFNLSYMPYHLTVHDLIFLMGTACFTHLLLLHLVCSMCAAHTTHLMPPDVIAAMCPAACPTNLILLHLITVTVLSEEWPKSFWPVKLTYCLAVWSRVNIENSSLAIEEIPCLLWDFKDYCHVHKIPPLVPTQTQMNPLPGSYISFF